MENEVYSLCFMCSIRCPIKVSARDGQVRWIEGNPHVPGMEGSLCPRGAAGINMLYDHERVQSPMIREGERGAGKWRKASWDEALDYVAEKLKAIIEAHGGHSVVLGERTNLNDSSAADAGEYPVAFGPFNCQRLRIPPVPVDDSGNVPAATHFARGALSSGRPPLRLEC